MFVTMQCLCLMLFFMYRLYVRFTCSLLESVFVHSAFQSMSPKGERGKKRPCAPAAMDSTHDGSAPSQQEPGEPSSSASAKKPKAWHKKGRHGRRDLLRAVQHRQSLANAEFYKLCDDPEATIPKMTWYPSDQFLQCAETYMLSRYANFLLQSVLLLTRVYQTPKIMLNTYGEGLMTSARVALLMMRTTHLKNDAATRLLSLKRHLYARMLKESETHEEVEAVISNEWKEDRGAGMKDRLDFFLKNEVAGQILSGIYPRTNLKYNAEKQWDNVWQVLSL